MTPILTELGCQAKIYHTTRGNEKSEQYDAPKHYSQWNHLADTLEIKGKNGWEYTVEIYTDGSKSSGGAGSGIAIFENDLSLQMMYRLANGCSINQAEQLAIAKALEKLRDFRHIQGLQRSAAVQTDSKITLDAIANLETVSTWLRKSGKE